MTQDEGGSKIGKKKCHVLFKRTIHPTFALKYYKKWPFYGFSYHTSCTPIIPYKLSIDQVTRYKLKVCKFLS